MVSIKKKQTSSQRVKKGKQSQRQQQTVIVNIDKRRRARNIRQELLKEQQQKLKQLQEISQMRSPEFQDLNIKIKDLEKEKETSSKREEELRAIQEKLKSLSQQFDKKPEIKVLGDTKGMEEIEVLGEKPKIVIKEPKPFKGKFKVIKPKPKRIEEESYITIPPNKTTEITPLVQEGTLTEPLFVGAKGEEVPNVKGMKYLNLTKGRYNQLTEEGITEGYPEYNDLTTAQRKYLITVYNAMFKHKEATKLKKKKSGKISNL